MEGMELRQIARDVYACLQEDRGLGYSNSGLVNRAGNVFGLMPHPERASETELGSCDGRLLLESLIRSLAHAG